mmetsp:Transcript_15136/g.30743  ORF Transcript_15136/g.30743 Transcript_15136/m.30743 type:complete len:231 (+) Transcript_15136:95-787(+)
MRCLIQHDSPLRQRLKYEKELIRIHLKECLLQISDSTVDQFGGPRRCPGREILPLHQPHPKTSQGRIQRNPRPRRTPTNHQHIQLVTLHSIMIHPGPQRIQLTFPRWDLLQRRNIPQIRSFPRCTQYPIINRRSTSTRNDQTSSHNHRSKQKSTHTSHYPHHESQSNQHTIFQKKEKRKKKKKQTNKQNPKKKQSTTYFEEKQERNPNQPSPKINPKTSSSLSPTSFPFR